MESRNGEVPSRLQVVTNINETSLLATARRRETAALDTLYRAHAEKPFRTVHRITRNREDAEDAVQASLLRAISPSQELRRKVNIFYLADTHWDQFGADDPSEEA